LSSEIFVTTQGGNFPHFLMGHRRFLYDGHAKTIIPDKRKLVLLLDDSSIRYILSLSLSLPHPPFIAAIYSVYTFQRIVGNI